MLPGSQAGRHRVERQYRKAEADVQAAKPKDDNGSVEALAKEFKGQRWDVDRSLWK
jgi:hypothetical protein